MFQALARLCLALPILLSSCGTPVAITDGDQALHHVRKLVEIGARPSGSPGFDKARTYIVDQLKALGLTAEIDRFPAETRRGPIEMSNIRCEIPGTTKSVCLILTHYDTKKMDAKNTQGLEFVGANDGGSGVGILLELARHYSKEKPPMSLRLLFVDGEETQGSIEWNESDALWGSRHEVERMKKDRLFDTTKAVILLDMVGHKNLAILQESQASARMVDAIREAAKETGASKHFFAKTDPIRDDHIPFLEAGMPDVIDLIELPFGPVTQQNPNGRFWHTTEDTLDKLSAQSLQIVGDVVVRAISKLARQYP